MEPITDTLKAFDHPATHTRVVFGPGAVDRIGTFATDWQARHALLVTDPHIVEADHAPRAARALQEAGIAVTVFDQVHENPTTDDVDHCVKCIQRADRAAGPVDTIVGIGGGSSMDTAKGANFIHTNGGRMQDYWGVGKASKEMLPLIAVPTTAGTGSECQSFALIGDAESHMKMACGDKKAAARVAILDPTLTLTQPKLVAADTGIDALTHAVETAVTLKRNDVSLSYARDSFRLIHQNLPIIFQEPDNLEARGQMLLAAAYAGTAIELSMLGAAHSAANPLSAHYDIIHGQAVGLMLPAVVAFNAQEPEARNLYRKLAAHAGLEASVEALLARLDELMQLTGLPRRLRDFDVPDDAIPRLAEEAAKQWTAQFNPRPVTALDFQSLYRAVA